jgi:hypothetical protein
MKNFAQRLFVPLLRSCLLAYTDPRLTPWANICRSLRELIQPRSGLTEVAQGVSPGSDQECESAPEGRQKTSCGKPR